MVFRTDVAVSPQDNSISKTESEETGQKGLCERADTRCKGSGIAYTDVPFVTIPELVPAQTFIECRTLSSALSDGMHTSRWKQSEGEVAFVYHYERSPHYVRFDARDFKKVSGETLGSYEALEALIVGLDQSAVLLLHTVVVIVREFGTARLRIDHLASFIYPRIRNHEERLSRRQSVVNALQVIASLRIIGQRRETYKGRDGSKLVVAIDGPLIELVNVSAGETEEDSGFVTVRAGAFLNKYRCDSRILHQIGNIRPVAGIACKRPSGALARDIALALLQLWREKARESVRSGNWAVEFSPIIRQRLLDRMSAVAQARLEEMLASSNPGRARDYWNDAVDLLQGKVIGQYRELGPISGKRETWKSAWLKQEIDIQPVSVISIQVSAIAHRTANCS